ncbi:hypothetical protein [Thiomicrorhabdus indica]|uniref:hypothetical protein n=1 Tax=Thiomicrorhabdus indica TaxID=2267253 RepID=UPI002AA7765B|nr:hypothetical protein [Thiomicrorhabdus indica]
MSTFAERIDRLQTQISRLIGKNPSRNIGERLARHIEKCFCLPEFWLDTDHQQPTEIVIHPGIPEKHAQLHQILQTIAEFAENKDIDQVTLAQLEEIADTIRNSKAMK